MEKVSKGQRVTITCQGMTVTGTVISADHETRYQDGTWEIIGYLLEIEADDGHVYYWKSLIDGGMITIHHQPEERIIEVRIRISDEKHWKDLPAYEYCCLTSEEAHTFCRVLLRSTSHAPELRWNWKGSPQGYYIQKGD